MSSATDRMKGTANQAIGRAKRRVGQAVGSNRLKGEGAYQEAKGIVQHTVGKARGVIKKAAAGRL
jgi:uncharacterized protein YjbJ (UPF0337 family)